MSSLYFPPAEKVSLLSKYDYPYWQKPEWLGFVHENKPYKLEDVVITSDLGIKGHYKTEKVTNPYLKRSFELKKSMSQAPTLTGYHGTRSCNVDSIVTNNFNWRLAGRSRGVKHGRGVCFSQRPIFTVQFCKGIENVVIETELICRNTGIGYVGDLLPPHGCDTSESPNGNVLVKFEDNEFLPLFVHRFNK